MTKSEILAEYLGLKSIKLEDNFSFDYKKKGYHIRTPDERLQEIDEYTEYLENRVKEFLVYNTMLTPLIDMIDWNKFTEYYYDKLTDKFLFNADPIIYKEHYIYIYD